jgi:tRNA (guanine6-N2)-methyltransferase
MSARLVARAVRGIEDLVADEVRDRGVGDVRGIGHREVHFTTANPAAALTALSTADDVLLLAARFDGVGGTKADLTRLRTALRTMDTARLLALRRELGGSRAGPGIDVSASFVGRRVFGRFDIEDTVGTYLQAAVGLPYHSRRGGARPPSGTCSWRVTLEGTCATVALRVNDRPSHRRGYRRTGVPGSLHPPLAAAMVRLAGVRDGDVVLDPCCGAGTLLIEAGIAVPAARLVGVDRDAGALRAARDNAAAVADARGRHPGWLPADAARLPLRPGCVDHVLVNPPWGRQALVRGGLAERPERLWSQVLRVLRPGGSLVALLHDDGQVSTIGRHGFTVTGTRTVRTAGILATVAVARKPGRSGDRCEDGQARSKTRPAAATSTSAP